MVDLAVLIYTVCGAGIGTSVLLKSNVDKVLERLGLEATVKAVSLAEASQPGIPAQLILATEEVLGELGDNFSEVVAIKSIFDLAELEQKVTEALG